jgi:hypothetical protein
MELWDFFYFAGNNDPLMRLALYVFILCLPVHVVGQVSTIAKKFSLPDSLLPKEKQWKKFYSQYQHDYILHFANKDSTKVFAVIVVRDDKKGVDLKENFYLSRTSHEVKQHVGPEDSVSFYGFPWYAMKYDGIYHRNTSAFSTGHFKAPDIATAVKYFALHELSSQKYFINPDAIWESHQFQIKKESGTDDPVIRGVPWVVSGSYTRLWYLRLQLAKRVHATMTKGMEIYDPRYHEIESTNHFEIVSNRDFTKTLIPFAFKDKTGARQLGYLYILYNGKYTSRIFLWSNNKTPVSIQPKARLKAEQVKLLSSYETSGWKVGETFDRQYIFNEAFWNNEVEKKTEKGTYQYLTLIGLGTDVMNAIWH